MDLNLNPQNAQVFAQAFAQALVHADKAMGQKAPVGAATPIGWFHGVGGIFGVPGLDEDVISARITPRGIARTLKVLPDIYTQPMFPYITGIEESGDDEPTTECATCPSGVTEGCIQSACYGFVCRETRELTPNRAIERINRGDLDLRLVNDILGLDQNDPFLAVRNYDRATIMQIATTWAMLEVGVMLQNKLVPMIWQGNPANNVGTGYAEFNGLDTLIGTGKVDFLTGTACEALDSDVKEFAYRLINSVDAQGNFRIVRDLEYLEAYLFHNADRMNLSPATWVIVMRPEAWYELTNIWPIAYLSTRNIVLPAGNTNMIDATRVKDDMDAMREGMFLYLNGRRHNVVLDDGIVEYNSTNDANLNMGEFASNIYFVPIKYMGNRDGTFLQHKDYRQAQREIVAAHSTDVMWSDAGRFLWTVERIKWCYTLSAKIEPRIVLKVPQLAGRLNHVKYTPRQHFREPWQDSDYFFKGGEDLRAFPFGTVYPDNAPSRGVTLTTGHCEDE
jgi:hypothetical protein